MEIIKKYFKNLSELQEKQLGMLDELYSDWNTKINVISRKDIDNLYEHHVLHSMVIGKYINLKDGSEVLDVGTGGGFPGIPMAILFPNVRFVLLDSIGKKIKVCTAVAEAIGLKNVETIQTRVEDEKRRFDFVISRATMMLGDLNKMARKNISKKQINALPNGFITLKGGDVQAEVQDFRKAVDVTNVSNYYEEEFFKTKKIVYLPVNS